MKRRLFRLVALVCAVLLALYYSVRISPQCCSQSLPLKPSSEFVVRGRLEPVGGVIEIGASSQYASPTVSQVLVKEGDIVKAGQVLAILNSASALDAEVASAEAEIEVARRQLEYEIRPFRQSEVSAAEAMLQASRIDEVLATSQVKRRKVLSSDVRSEAEDERDNAEMLRAIARRSKAEADLAMVTEISASKVAIARAQVTLAEARLRSKKAAASLAVIRSTVAGQVLRVLVKPGEVVTVGPMIEIADIQNLKVIAEVDARLIERVNVGAQAEVRLRGGKGTWQARVESVGSIVLTSDRPPVDVETVRVGRFVEVALVLENEVNLPRVAGLELSVYFDGSVPSQ